MDLCTSSVSPSNCGHYNITVTVDGTPINLHVANSELLEPLSADERETFVRLAARRLRQRGVTLAQFVNRITHGEEATNVKPYEFLGPGGAVVLTNMRGIAADVWQNLLPGANGERIPVDFTGATEFLAYASAIWPGTGTHGIRILRSGGDASVLFETTTIPAQAGERELDSNWVTIPPAFKTNLPPSGLDRVLVMVTSSVAANDPTYRRVGLLVR